ncbi:MAG: hypothetical protein ACRC92_20335 [Peptostreptococcaceae bacterium]
MKWHPMLNAYQSEIIEQIKQYAYENAIYEPIITKATLPEDHWFGNTFDVANMPTDLHDDILNYMARSGFLHKVRDAKYDEYVILPDIFSEKDTQLTYPEGPNIYDMDRRQIVYMNNKLFEIVDNRDLHSLKFNYNNKTYIFYNKLNKGDLFNGSHLELIDFKEYSFIDEDPNVEPFWNKEDKLLLKFTENNKLFVNDEVPNEAFVNVGMVHPYLMFDYHTDFGNEIIKEDPRLKVGGLKTFSKDQFVMERNIPHETGELMIHNRSVIFSTSAVIIYKDNSYKIESFKYPIYRSIIRRLDKHTVFIEKDDNIKTIILFLNPIGMTRPEFRVDDLYDRMTRYSSKAFMLLSKHTKNTSLLIEQITRFDDMTIEDFIDYGYRYDRDVLKIIQNAFPTFKSLDKLNDVFVSMTLMEEKFYYPRVIIRVENRLKLFPQIIINGRMISTGYKIKKNYGLDFIILDPIRVFGISKELVESKNVAEIERLIRGHINTVDVAFISSSYYDLDKRVKRATRHLSDSKLHKRIFSINNFYKVEDNVDSDSEVFLNGRMVYSKYNTNPEYLMNYGIHRVPIYKNVAEESILDYYDYMETTPTEVSMGYTGNNKSINLLSTVPNDNAFYLDVTKETSPNRNMMILNLPDGVKLQTHTFNNHSEQGADGITPKIPLPETPTIVNKNTTMFIDYDGLVYRAEILTERHIDPNSIVVYDYMYTTPNINSETGIGFNKRTNKKIGVNYINLGIRDLALGFDLNIDDSKIHPTMNMGSYNENCMKDELVSELFDYNPMTFTKIPIGTNASTFSTLLKMKVYMSFWFAHNNVTSLSGHTEYVTILNMYDNLFQSNGIPVKVEIDKIYELDQTFDSTTCLYDIDVSVDLVRQMYADMSIGDSHSIMNELIITDKNFSFEVSDKHLMGSLLNNNLSLSAVMDIKN